MSFLALVGFVNLSMAEALDGGGTFTSSIHYNLDACDAFVMAGTLADYSEFTGVATNDASCTTLSAIGTVCRANPSLNTHSCTNGVNGTNAMCVSSDESCTYNPGNIKSIKFDVMLTPDITGSGTLSNISFYEAAPATYLWLQGPTGPNNYPTQYGVRVLKNGVEIFQSSDNATTLDWTLEEFIFDGPEFTVTNPTVFTFELLGYCPVGNGATVSAWDVDEITVNSICDANNLEGGNLTTAAGETEISICANDGVSDAFDVILTGTTGTSSAWVITDTSGEILALPAGPPFDLEGAGSGTCFVWHLTFEGTITGATVGENVNGLTGCYALSNPIVVNRNMQGSGTISISGSGATETTICVGDGIADPIDVDIVGLTAMNNIWVITDSAGNILGLPTGPPFDLEGAGIGACNIWNISFDGTLTGADVGSNISGLLGCFGLSNAITVNRTMAVAGMISENGVTEFSICAGDGVPDLINPTVTGNVGDNEAWLLTDANGNIRSLLGNPPFNLDGGVQGTCLIWHLSYGGSISGLTVGSNANNLQGCFGLSNPITVNKTRTAGGVLSSNNFTFINVCEGDGLSNVIELTLNNNMGQNVAYFLADVNGNITQFVTPPVDFTTFAPGRYIIYALSYDGPDSGLMIGQNVSSLSGGCNGLSNPVTIAKERANGGIITSPNGDNFSVCVQGNVTEGIELSLSGNVGTRSRWIVTDLNGNIIALPGPPPINIQISGPQTCQIWHLSTEPSFSGLIQGNNVANFQGCFDLSNPITVNKTVANGGVLSTLTNTTSVDICTNDGLGAVVNTVLNGAVGDNNQWVITDQNNNILDLPTSSPFDFSAYANGFYRIWNLAFNGTLNGATIGSNAEDLTGDCFDLSNFISVNISGATAGTISSPNGDNFDICVGNGTSDLIDFAVTGNTGNGRWLVTDANGNITDLPGNPPFNLNTAGGGTCLVWYVAFETGVSGLQIGNNANDLAGCFDLAGPITINKTNVEGGTLTTADGETDLEICVDGISDAFDVILVGNTGSVNAWVITDSQGNILALPASPPFDLDSAGVGTCQVWNLTYEGTITGVNVGANVSGLMGCYALSTPITVVRSEKDAGTISSNGSTDLSICIDGGPSNIDVQVTGGINSGTQGWVITDEQGVILALPSGPPFDLSGAGVGTCSIWRICYASGTTGIMVGANVSGLDGCFDLSNPITVVRSEFDATGTTTSTYVFDLDACYADTQDNSNCDYSEFKGVATNDVACTQFSASGDGCVYRENPTVNKHSCTPGVNGSTAMCVGSLDDCTYVADSDKAIRFEIEVNPGSNGIGNISTVSFFEKAPLMFDWINGASGLNNYPTLFGVRVLKDGVEVYNQSGLSTTPDWSLESFDFSNNPAFSVSSSTVFSFELLGYCTVGNGATVNAWDIDQIEISSTCDGGLTGGILEIEGGGTEIEICADDGVSDAFDVTLTGAAGPNSAWVITDDMGMILALPAGPPFDLEGAGAGACLVWHLSFANGLTGAAVGNNANDLEGCYSLSNPITVIRNVGTDCTTTVIESEEEEEDAAAFVSSFVIMPNPAVENLILQTDKKPFEGTQVYIYDRMGQVIDSQVVKTRDVNIDISNYPEGIYYVKMNSGTNKMAKTFIKLRG